MKKINFLLSFFLLMTAMPVSLMAAPSIDYPMVKLQALDKSTARTTTLNVKVGETAQYGSLFIKVQACRESQPLEAPESASFLQVWEVPVNSDKSEWIFSGWMFASSPALSAMDHAVYDVWVLDCIDEEKPAQQPAEASVTATVGDTEEDNISEIETQAIESIELVPVE